MDCTPKGGINPNELDYLTIVVESDYCEVWPYPMQLKMEDNTFVDSVLLFSRNGGSWTSIEYDEETGELIPLTLRKGDVVRFKGNGYDFTTMYPIWFDSLGAFRTAWNYGIYGDYGYYSVQGTPLSLWYGDDFKSKANEVLPESCFCELFANGVDKLIRINNPKTFLPYTNLSVSCYDSMFVNCSRLLNAPVLPATTLVEDCYKAMYRGCANLSYIKMLATDISAARCLQGWGRNISTYGLFVQNPSADWEDRGDSGIPTDWQLAKEGTEWVYSKSFIGLDEAQWGDYTEVANMVRGMLSAFGYIDSTTYEGYDILTVDNIPPEFQITINGESVTRLEADIADLNSMLYIYSDSYLINMYSDASQIYISSY